ncbi:MAG: glycosyltransferase [Thermosphaera sp.]
MALAPIVLFVYNRPWHLRQTIEALQNNELADQSELFIFSDGPKDEKDGEKVRQVRKYLKTIEGFKRVAIIEREKNFGLANNIINGVTRIVNENGKIIVLEDDLITSPCFLRFMNEALEMYKDEERVACISGYIYPIKDLPETFFIRGADCWGWGTWKEKWAIFEPNGRKLLKELKDRNLQKEADFNNAYGFTKMLKDQIKGRNDSWAIRWYMSAFLKDMLTLYPGESYVQNIGFDAEGTHCKSGDHFYKSEKLNSEVRVRKIPVEEDNDARKKIEDFLRSTKPKFSNKLWKLLGSSVKSVVIFR